MLVLKRRKGDTIRVDGPCTITVVRVDGGQCLIGIAADKSVSVMRGELAGDTYHRPAMTAPGPETPTQN